jgi:hypothetical protein
MGGVGEAGQGVDLDQEVVVTGDEIRILTNPHLSLRLRRRWRALGFMRDWAQRSGLCCGHCYGWHLDRSGRRDGPCAYPGCGCERYVYPASDPSEHQEIYNEVLEAHRG